MAKKIVANGDDTPVMLSPGTFGRHSAAAGYVLGATRTDPPRGDRSRFPHAAPGAWGLLASGGTISAASGVTLGTGTVDLCDSSGVAYSPTVSVGVKNAGAAITASGDRLLPLEWVLGDWTVCGGAGGTVPTSCFACFGFSPSPLTITDANATFTAPWSVSPGQWFGGYTKPATGADSVTPFGLGYTYTTGPITLGIGYSVTCGGGSTPKLIVARGWAAFGVNSPDVDCSFPAASYIYIDQSLASTNYCPLPAINPTTDSKNGTLTITQCGPLICSGSLTTGSPFTPDPAPGTVTLTNTPRWLMEEWLRSGNPDRVRHALYKLRLLDNPDEPPGVLHADGRYEPGNPATWTPPTAEDLALRAYAERHGKCCG